MGSKSSASLDSLPEGGVPRVIASKRSILREKRLPFTDPCYKF